MDKQGSAQPSHTREDRTKLDHRSKLASARQGFGLPAAM
jgi:hypothetical protein